MLCAVWGAVIPGLALPERSGLSCVTAESRGSARVGRAGWKFFFSSISVFTQTWFVQSPSKVCPHRGGSAMAWGSPCAAHFVHRIRRNLWNFEQKPRCGFEMLIFNSCDARGQSSAGSAESADEKQQHEVVADVIFVIASAPAFLQPLVLSPLP